MRNIIFVCLFIFTISSLAAFAGDGKQYGKKLTLKKTTKVSEVLANPEKFVGKKVLIKGTIVDVCKKRGCWMDISSDKEFEKIKVKVEDGVIVFPLTAKGKTATVEGEVYAITSAVEECSNKEEHSGEEHGEECEHSKTKSEKTIYQIKGLGAVIK
ncbi:MAG: DUF4920 domain-containing protein [Bacteroidetes bacterium]|nr:DUF4920 domain-containing protein [Bacteroidota bacterium]MBU2584289.1 DUF4920 domain-containing protein [Bacteroidota bacterium]